jgi:hypothetical protein
VRWLWCVRNVDTADACDVRLRAAPLAAQWLANNGAILLVGLAIIMFMLGVKQALEVNLQGMKQDMKHDLERLEHAMVSVRPRSVAFSAVSQTHAAQLLRAAQLTLVNGDAAELRATRARRTASVPNFVWPARTSEAAGTPAALQHIQTCLQQLGVTFGCGGYSMLDMHTRNKSLAFAVGGVLFKGGVDGAIVPFSVAPLSAPNHARVVLELKTRAARPDEDLGDSAVGQCIAELVGVNAQVVALPCIVLLTDGTVCDLLRIRGTLVTRWAGVPLADALAYVAEFLMSESSPAILESHADGEPLLDAATLHTLQRLQQFTPVTGGALAAAAEQLESLLGVEEGDDADAADTQAFAAQRRSALAAELASQWRHALEPQELPQHVAHLFA